MSLNIDGNNISDIYVGDNRIDSIYLGSNCVYSTDNYYLGFKPYNSNEVCSVKLYRYMDEGATPSSFTSYVAPTFYYSYDCKTWSSYSLGTVLQIGGNNAKAVYFKGDNLQTWYDFYKNNEDVYLYTYINFVMTGNIKAIGDIMSLRYSNPDNSNINVIPCTYAFYSLFRDCTSLIAAPSLSATTLEASCYSSIFRGCTSLIAAPSLPATTLGASCYSAMFWNCTSLVTPPPKLPAINLSSACYVSMFNNCTSLVIPPELPATILTDSCYMSMFQDCTSLITTPSLLATTLGESCYNFMFYGCTSLTQISKLPALTIPEGNILGTYGSMFKNSSVRANDTSLDVCIYPYRIPTSDTGTCSSKALSDMFVNLDGTGSFTPTINTEFYINVPSF